MIVVCERKRGREGGGEGRERKRGKWGNGGGGWREGRKEGQYEGKQKRSLKERVCEMQSTNTRMSVKSLIFAKVNHENHVKPHGSVI